LTTKTTLPRSDSKGKADPSDFFAESENQEFVVVSLMLLEPPFELDDKGLGNTPIKTKIA
jgi:hypothetical protein